MGAFQAAYFSKISLSETRRCNFGKVWASWETRFSKISLSGIRLARFWQSRGFPGGKLYQKLTSEIHPGKFLEKQRLPRRHIFPKFDFQAPPGCVFGKAGAFPAAHFSKNPHRTSETYQKGITEIRLIRSENRNIKNSIFIIYITNELSRKTAILSKINI